MKSILSFLMILFIGVFSGIAQTNMTKIKDGTVAGSTAIPGPGVILELESANKGFLTPRLTTQQRDAIPVVNRADGLLIYNKTTGCFNYWSVAQDTWLSLCGTPPPAVFEITSLQCGAITVNGQFKQGIFLTSSNYLTIPVTVTQAGTYELTATTTNGYYFTTKGTFPSAGNYTLILEGIGTPDNGYNTGEQGDRLTITLNNKVNSCERYVFVENANVSYEVSCTETLIDGVYMIGQTLTNSHKMIVTVNVYTIGYWSIATNTNNGYSFRGSGNFAVPGFHTIELLGTGTPIASGTDSFSFTTNSDATRRASCTGIQVSVLPIKYTVDCTQAVVNGVYKQDEPMTASNTVTIKVNVQATGDTSIRTNTVAGIYFTSGPLSFDTLGERNVVLSAVGTPTAPGTHTYTLDAATGMVATCAFDIEVTAQPVSYTMNCQSILTYGTFAPGVPMDAVNRMVVSVDVQYPGPYTITTNTVNGITFSATGTFANTGTQAVVLWATGTPLAGGTHRYTITTDSSFGANTCNKNIDFRYRRINILALGGAGYYPGTSDTKWSARTLLTTPANFGPNGTVKTEALNIVDGAKYQDTRLKNLINSNQIDMIIVGYDYVANSGTIAVFEDFVKNKKGVLLYGQEGILSGQITASRDLINAMGYSAGTTLTKGTGVWTNTIPNIADPSLDGPFGNIAGKNLGNDVDNTMYVTGYSNEYLNLSGKLGDPSSAHVLKHKTLGFVFTGDGGWLAGNVTDNSDKIFPVRRTEGGLPTTKPYYNGVTVYNSFFYVNTVAWAIQYIQENTDVNYQLQ